MTNKVKHKKLTTKLQPLKLINANKEQRNVNLLTSVDTDTMNFSKQVDEVVNGNFNKDNQLTILYETPKLLQDLGFKNLPITVTNKKLDRIMNENGSQNGEYHNLGIDLVKKLPKAINNPLDIIKSHNNNYVLTTDLSDKQDRSVIVSIKFDGKGNIDNINQVLNVMTSAYGRNNYENYMKNNADNIIWDIDRGFINNKKTSNPKGLQLSDRVTGRTENSSFSNNNINPTNENVNRIN
jgi:hypothetical protein